MRLYTDSSVLAYIVTVWGSASLETTTNKLKVPHQQSSCSPPNLSGGARGQSSRPGRWRQWLTPSHNNVPDTLGENAVGSETGVDHRRRVYHGRASQGNVPSLSAALPSLLPVIMLLLLFIPSLQGFIRRLENLTCPAGYYQQEVALEECKPDCHQIRKMWLGSLDCRCTLLLIQAAECSLHSHQKCCAGYRYGTEQSCRSNYSVTK